MIGGAAIASYRLHRALRGISVDSSMLVMNAINKDAEIDCIRHRRFPEYVMGGIGERVGLNNLFNYRSFFFNGYKGVDEADIINLHNLHPHYFNYLALPFLTKNTPAVHTLHDMWAFTGHCAYSFECERYSQGCGKCPDLSVYPGIRYDNTKMALKLKKWAYRNSNITLVAPSKWMKRVAEKSILKDIPIQHIPNGVDTKLFRPHNQKECRRLLGISESEFIVLFAAESVSNMRKGGQYILPALKLLPDSLKENLRLLTFGRGGVNEDNAQLKSLNLGYIDSDVIKAIAYSAADLFLHCSAADNLPLVLQESMSCGTPMVAFDVGGISDLVRPGETGVLVPPNEIEHFANSIENLFNDSTLLQKMRERCREIAVREYDVMTQAKRYKSLYKKLII